MKMTYSNYLFYIRCFLQVSFSSTHLFRFFVVVFVWWRTHFDIMSLRPSAIMRCFAAIWTLVSFGAGLVRQSFGRFLCTVVFFFTIWRLASAILLRATSSRSFRVLWRRILCPLKSRLIASDTVCFFPLFPTFLRDVPDLRWFINRDSFSCTVSRKSETRLYASWTLSDASEVVSASPTKSCLL